MSHKHNNVFASLEKKALLFKNAQWVHNICIALFDVILNNW